jgi:GAF domain-containing protein
MERVFIEECLTDIQTSPVDCLGKILKRICKAVGCEFGVILTFDKRRNQLALDVVHGYSPEVIRTYRSERLTFTIIPRKRAVSVDAYLNAQDTGQAKPVLVPGDSPLTHPLQTVKWVLGFPIASMGEWVGVFTLESLRDNVLEDLAKTDDIKLLSLFSNLIAAALASRQSLVFAFDEFIEENQFTDIKTLSAQALNWVFEKFKVNSCAIYFAAYEEGQSFVACTGAFINKKFEADVDSVRYEIGEGFAGWVAGNQHSLILTEVDNEESIELQNYQKDFERPHRARKLASKNQELGDFKSYMGVPITDGQETVGVLEIFDQEREYAFSDEALLEMIARRIAIEYKRISKTQKRDSLFEISKFGTGDRDTVIEDVMKTAMKAAAATHGFFMYKESDGSFKPLSIMGHDLSAADIPLVASNEENLITWVMTELKEVNSPDCKKEGVRPRDDIPENSWANSFKPTGFIPKNIRSLLMVPVYLGNKQKNGAAKTQAIDQSEASDSEIETLGVLVLMSTKANAFQQDEVVVTVLAQIVSYHIWANKKITELESKKSEISELRQLMPQYEHATIAAAVTAGTMHTVRNHVDNITESLDKLLALDAIKGDPDSRKLGDTVRKPFDELSTLYGRLFTNVFGAFNPVFESCDMAALIQDARDYMEPTFRKRGGVNFKSFVKEARLPPVKADSILMKVVFINILKNSIDANARNIVVRGKRVAGYLGKPALELAFEDDGIGIPKMTKVDAGGSPVLDDSGDPILNWDAIFKPFETAHKKGGTGLGLAVNREIMNKHSGEIRVVSSTVDGKHGTVIAVTLPL